jgi:predicted amidohydrolase YtcJ
LGGGLPLQSNRTVVLHGTLIDGTGSPPIRDSLILIEDGVITYAGKREDRFLSKPAFRIIDASNKWVIPGLTDMHVHYEDCMGKLFLANGVTTIKDTGNDPDWVIKERDRINMSSAVSAPRIVACGPVIDGNV